MTVTLDILVNSNLQTASSFTRLGASVYYPESVFLVFSGVLESKNGFAVFVLVGPVLREVQATLRNPNARFPQFWTSSDNAAKNHLILAVVR